MQNSVTWYFQELDRQAGFSAVRDFIEQTGYGNQAVPENLSSYWTDSSLTISAIEQVELLQKFGDRGCARRGVLLIINLPDVMFRII